MKILALIIIGLLSLLWGYFSWRYLNIDTLDSVTITILLAGVFVFGILFGKISLLKEKFHSSTHYNKEDEITSKKYITEIESVEIKEKSTNSFSQFEDVQDSTFLNIANNQKSKKKDNLKIIEGIGPKIEELLNQEGIYSYSDLVGTEIATIKTILEAAGPRYIMHNPSTWKKQASIANSGNLEKLQTYQNSLNKGVEI